MCANLTVSTDLAFSGPTGSNAATDPEGQIRDALARLEPAARKALLLALLGENL